jgi:hypothetical protein
MPRAKVPESLKHRTVHFITVAGAGRLDVTFYSVRYYRTNRPVRRAIVTGFIHPLPEWSTRTIHLLLEKLVSAMEADRDDASLWLMTVLRCPGLQGHPH